MKLLVLSDLHLEFGAFRVDSHAADAADAVVLAGDIHKGVHALRWIAESFARKPVIYVAGNHEFYSHHWSATLQALREAADKQGTYFLENDVLELHGVRFLGCSLWTDFAYFGQERRTDAMRDYEHGLNDCFMIEASPAAGSSRGATVGRLTAAHVLARHEESIAWLGRELHKGYPGKTVVVTHHLPSRRSVAKQYVDDRLTPGFASELPVSLITCADLWIHGHAHDSCDYVLQGRERKTRVVANPKGYPRRTAKGCENAGFRGDLLIEV